MWRPNNCMKEYKYFKHIVNKNVGLVLVCGRYELFYNIMHVPVLTDILRHPSDCSLPPDEAASILERRSKLCGKL